MKISQVTHEEIIAFSKELNMTAESVCAGLNAYMNALRSREKLEHLRYTETITPMIESWHWGQNPSYIPTSKLK